MSGDTVECFNCGNSNPAWAQVCRSCGAPIVRSPTGGRGSGGIFPTDQASLISIGAAVGSIVLAIVVGLVFAGIVPPAPNVAEPTPTPIPSVSAEPSLSEAPSGSGSETPVPTPPLIGTITYGYGLNTSTHEVTDPTDTFGPGTRFCYSILLTEPFGVSTLSEEVVRVEADGSLKVVQARENESVDVTPGLMIAGYNVRTNGLISAWGAGNFIMREYRGAELIAEGRFTFTK
jgi:hypothetical protein